MGPGFLGQKKGSDWEILVMGRSLAFTNLIGRPQGGGNRVRHGSRLWGKRPNGTSNIREGKKNLAYPGRLEIRFLKLNSQEGL
jgi:hypothetical protein